MAMFNVKLIILSNMLLIEGRLIALIVYVDDIVFKGHNEEEISCLKKLLAKEFEIKDLAYLKYFLGMEVARSSKAISVSQKKYVVDLLKETRMTESKLADTLMDLNTKLGFRLRGSTIDKGKYQRLVENLISPTLVQILGSQSMWLVSL